MELPVVQQFSIDDEIIILYDNVILFIWFWFSGLKDTLHNYVIHTMVFCILCKNFVFCVSEISTNFTTQKVGIVHIPRGHYIFSKWFSHWQVILGLQMCLYFCLKTPLSKIYFIFLFFTQNHWSSLCSIPQFPDSRSPWHIPVETSGKLSGYWCSNPRFIKSF